MASPTPLKVLYTLHPDHDTLDLTGPLEILSHGFYPSTSTSERTKIFSPHTLTAISPVTTTNQGLKITRDISIPEAYAQLSTFDVLVIPGGGSPGVLSGKTEPIDLIRAFASLPRKADGGIRTLLSVCTGSLFLAEAGVLDGLTATTHPFYYGKLREICGEKGKTTVVEERFVVNRTDEERGLRVITSGGVSCGLDSCVWLIGDIGGPEAAARTAEGVQYAPRQGIVI